MPVARATPAISLEVNRDTAALPPWFIGVSASAVCVLDRPRRRLILLSREPACPEVHIVRRRVIDLRDEHRVFIVPVHQEDSTRVRDDVQPRCTPRPPRALFAGAVAVADRRHRSIAKNKRLDEALVVRRAPRAARILLSGG